MKKNQTIRANNKKKVRESLLVYSLIVHLGKEDKDWCLLYAEEGKH